MKSSKCALLHIQLLYVKLCGYVFEVAKNKNLAAGVADATRPMKETKCETAWPSLFAASGGYNTATVKAPNKYQTNRMANKYLYQKNRHSFTWNVRSVAITPAMQQLPFEQVKNKTYKIFHLPNEIVGPNNTNYGWLCGLVFLQKEYIRPSIIIII